MRALSLAICLIAGFAATALAGPDLSRGATAPGCPERTAPAAAMSIQLAQSSCRGECSTRRGYCMSTCRDSQCRAICNDLYHSCVARCR
ncbi:MAG: hypothetical protein KIT16_08500 [Rhodospirillaceae bacterium]|nr:hypothetical protein [Rhodospirillaceae bacterium]